MKDYLDKLHEIIISRINEYTPKDKDLKSPTSSHIKSLLYYYKYKNDERNELFDELQEQHGLDDVNPLGEYDEELFYKLISPVTTNHSTNMH